MIDPFLLRLLIGALVLFIFTAFFGILELDAKVTRILNIVLIIGVVLYVVFGSFLPFR